MKDIKQYLTESKVDLDEMMGCWKDYFDYKVLQNSDSERLLRKELKEMINNEEDTTSIIYWGYDFLKDLCKYTDKDIEKYKKELIEAIKRWAKEYLDNKYEIH